MYGMTRCVASMSFLPTGPSGVATVSGDSAPDVRPVNLFRFLPTA